MKAMMPYIEVLGDNETSKTLLAAKGNSYYQLRPNIMARSGSFMGMTRDLAVWRFGYSPESEAASAYGVSIPKSHNSNEWPGFLWILATRKTGKVKESFFGYAVELPQHFKDVIEKEF